MNFRHIEMKYGAKFSHKLPCPTAVAFSAHNELQHSKACAQKEEIINY
jgi:hypothetical protein